LRLIWVYPGSWLANLVYCRIITRAQAARPREVFVIGWTGMRGVVSLPRHWRFRRSWPTAPRFLSAASSSSSLLRHPGHAGASGSDPRSAVRWLGLEGSAGPDCEEEEARRNRAGAALEFWSRHAKSGMRFRTRFRRPDRPLRHRLAGLQPSKADPEHVTHHYSFLEISRETTRIERETAVRLRNEGRINDQVLRRIERELDFNESRFAETSGD